MFSIFSSDSIMIPRAPYWDEPGSVPTFDRFTSKGRMVTLARRRLRTSWSSITIVIGVPRPRIVDDRSLLRTGCGGHGGRPCHIRRKSSVAYATRGERKPPCKEWEPLWQSPESRSRTVSENEPMHCGSRMAGVTVAPTITGDKPDLKWKPRRPGLATMPPVQGRMYPLPHHPR
jgi:hypothetical protein